LRRWPKATGEIRVYYNRTDRKRTAQATCAVTFGRRRHLIKETTLQEKNHD
jgi:hypothetical protein